MEKLNENNLYLKVLKFGEKHPKGFTYDELKKSINLEDWEDAIIKEYLINAIKTSKYYDNIYRSSYKESIFFMVECKIPEYSTHSPENDINIAKFIIKYDAYFNYIDFLELQKAIKNSEEANEHAKDAKWWAIGSIIIAIITGVFQVSSDSLLIKWIRNLF